MKSNYAFAQQFSCLTSNYLIVIVKSLITKKTIFASVFNNNQTSSKEITNISALAKLNQSFANKLNAIYSSSFQLVCIVYHGGFIETLTNLLNPRYLWVSQTVALNYARVNPWAWLKCVSWPLLPSFTFISVSHILEKFCGSSTRFKLLKTPRFHEW